MKRLIHWFFALIFFTGCIFDGTPEGIIHKDKMISLLTDIHLVDGYLGILGQDNSKQVQVNLYQSVFNKYHTDSIEFRKSLEYYAKKPKELHDMYKEVQSNLDNLDNEQVRRSQEKSKVKK
jgi:hypothetical protein